ncbi:hypothetical protein H5410_050488 [Solanum commersonii]|uniref:Uncharacterized protein n=1 Tax=Solanum commersonii TaxID=4109 RepID=A0A9J5WX75_SOLCO|nr:hypothetical protein H5410_050488 [Solanum commersonii]
MKSGFGQKKKQGYGYHDRSPLIKKNLSKSLRVSGGFKHLKYAGIKNDIAFLIENDDSFRKNKLIQEAIFTGGMPCSLAIPTLIKRLKAPTEDRLQNYNREFLLLKRYLRRATGPGRVRKALMTREPNTRDSTAKLFGSQRRHPPVIVSSTEQVSHRSEERKRPPLKKKRNSLGLQKKGNYIIKSSFKPVRSIVSKKENKGPIFTFRHTTMDRGGVRQRKCNMIKEFRSEYWEVRIVEDDESKTTSLTRLRRLFFASSTPRKEKIRSVTADFLITVRVSSRLASSEPETKDSKPDSRDSLDLLLGGTAPRTVHPLSIHRALARFRHEPTNQLSSFSTSSRGQSLALADRLDDIGTLYFIFGAIAGVTDKVNLEYSVRCFQYEYTQKSASPHPLGMQPYPLVTRSTVLQTPARQKGGLGQKD